MSQRFWTIAAILTNGLALAYALLLVGAPRVASFTIYQGSQPAIDINLLGTCYLDPDWVAQENLPRDNYDVTFGTCTQWVWLEFCPQGASRGDESCVSPDEVDLEAIAALKEARDAERTGGSFKGLLFPQEIEVTGPAVIGQILGPNGEVIGGTANPFVNQSYCLGAGYGTATNQGSCQSAGGTWTVGGTAISGNCHGAGGAAAGSSSGGDAQSDCIASGGRWCASGDSECNNNLGMSKKAADILKLRQLGINDAAIEKYGANIAAMCADAALADQMENLCFGLDEDTMRVRNRLQELFREGRGRDAIMGVLRDEFPDYLFFEQFETRLSALLAGAAGLQSILDAQPDELKAFFLDLEKQQQISEILVTTESIDERIKALQDLGLELPGDLIDELTQRFGAAATIENVGIQLGSDILSILYGQEYDRAVDERNGYIDICQQSPGSDICQDLTGVIRGCTEKAEGGIDINKDPACNGDQLMLDLCGSTPAGRRTGCDAVKCYVTNTCIGDDSYRGKALKNLEELCAVKGGATVCSPEFRAAYMEQCGEDGEDNPGCISLVGYLNICFPAQGNPDVSCDFDNPLYEIVLETLPKGRSQALKDFSIFQCQQQGGTETDCYRDAFREGNVLQSEIDGYNRLVDYCNKNPGFCTQPLDPAGHDMRGLGDCFTAGRGGRASLGTDISFVECQERGGSSWEFAGVSTQGTTFVFPTDAAGAQSYSNFVLAKILAGTGFAGSDLRGITTSELPQFEQIFPPDFDPTKTRIGGIDEVLGEPGEPLPALSEVSAPETGEITAPTFFAFKCGPSGELHASMSLSEIINCANAGSFCVQDLTKTEPTCVQGELDAYAALRKIGALGEVPFFDRDIPGGEAPRGAAQGIRTYCQGGSGSSSFSENLTTNGGIEICLANVGNQVCLRSPSGDSDCVESREAYVTILELYLGTTAEGDLTFPIGPYNESSGLTEQGPFKYEGGTEEFIEKEFVNITYNFGFNADCVDGTGATAYSFSMSQGMVGIRDCLSNGGYVRDFYGYSSQAESSWRLYLQGLVRKGGYRGLGGSGPYVPLNNPSQ